MGVAVSFWKIETLELLIQRYLYDVPGLVKIDSMTLEKTNSNE